MKKRLEADLISIAHRILQLKNKSDVNQLYLETQKLYEKLAILRFVEEHFGEAKPTIGQAEIVEKMKQFFDNNADFGYAPTNVKEKIVPEEISKEEIAEPLLEEELQEEVEEEEEIVELLADEETKIKLAEEEIDIKVLDEVVEEELEEEAIEELEILPEIVVAESIEVEDIGFKPAFQLDEPNEMDTPNQSQAVQISFEDLLGGNYSDTFFVKVDQTEDMPIDIKIETPIALDVPIAIDMQEKIINAISNGNSESHAQEDSKTVSLNEKLSKGINIDLNDRIAFVKHLFGNSNEDYNRVLSQLITFNTFYETRDFIEDMVKPDYNNWEGKDDYAERFMEIIEKKFL